MPTTRRAPPPSGDVPEPPQVVVDFTAQWCGPCRMIGPKFEEFSLTYTDLLFVKVDVDDCDSVAAKAGISAMPTFQVYKAGQKVDEIVGASPEKLEALIKAALTKGGGRGSPPPPPAAAPALHFLWL